MLMINLSAQICIPTEGYYQVKSCKIILAHCKKKKINK